MPYGTLLPYTVGPGKTVSTGSSKEGLESEVVRSLADYRQPLETLAGVAFIEGSDELRPEVVLALDAVEVDEKEIALGELIRSSAGRSRFPKQEVAVAEVRRAIVEARTGIDRKLGEIMTRPGDADTITNYFYARELAGDLVVIGVTTGQLKQELRGFKSSPKA